MRLTDLTNRDESLLNKTFNLIIIKQTCILNVKLANTRVCAQLVGLAKCVVLSQIQLPQFPDLLLRYAVPREEELLVIPFALPAQQTLAILLIEYIRLQIGDRCIGLLRQDARNEHIINPEIIVELCCLIQTFHHIL